LFLLFVLSTTASAVSIEFETANATFNESNGFAAVNLKRRGSHSSAITVYISVTRIDDRAIVQCMYLNVAHYSMYKESNCGIFSFNR